MAKADPRAKFVDLAEKRVNRTLKDIRLIANLSNKSNYKYGQEDVAKIYRALKTALDEMKTKFESNGHSGPGDFKL